MRRVFAAAILVAATSFSAPAYATTDEYLERFCERFLDNYETVLASYRGDREAGDRVHLARYHYYQHLRRKLRRTAQFCEHLIDSHDNGTSEESQSYSYSYISVLR